MKNTMKRMLVLGLAAMFLFQGCAKEAEESYVEETPAVEEIVEEVVDEMQEVVEDVFEE